MNDGGKGSDRRPGEGYQLGWDRVFSRGVKTQSIPQAITQIPQAHSSKAMTAIAYGIRRVTDDVGVEKWEDIFSSYHKAHEEAGGLMLTGMGEIYEVVPLYSNLNCQIAQSDNFEDLDMTSAYQRGYLDGMAKRPQSLTDEQIIEWVESGEYNVITNDWASHIAFARAIEAAHGIKEAP